jgi:hypothetical protein
MDRNNSNETLNITPLMDPDDHEVPSFIPTRRELLILTRYWADFAIDLEYAVALARYDIDCDCLSECMYDVHRAWSRVYAINDLLGDEVDTIVG